MIKQRERNSEKVDYDVIMGKTENFLKMDKRFPKLQVMGNMSR